MLKYLHLKNFAIIDHLELDLQNNMTVITGETGAGKSIVIDAIELALGARAKPHAIRSGCERAEICLSFDISQLSDVQQWLDEHDLNHEKECMIRRTITADNRGKCFINDTPTTVQRLKELGEFLVNIHGQHETQSLFKQVMQRKLLEAYAGKQTLSKIVKKLYQQWQSTKNEYEALKNNTQQANARADFLRYQLDELTKLQLTEAELVEINQEHKRLSNAADLIQACQQALGLIEQDEQSINSIIYRAQQNLLPFESLDKQIKNTLELLNNASVQLEEANHELQDFLSRTELDPERLQEIEARLSLIHDIARKHHVKPQELPALYNQLSQELDNLTHSDEQLLSLEKNIEKLSAEYQKEAQSLSKIRQQAAKKLSLAVTENLHQLGMPHAQFIIELKATPQFTEYGLENTEFLVSANPGQAAQSLAKVASGGELSRISLAIQAITAQQHTLPTLIFDEVDVGIGGAVAEVVGELLKTLANSAQVLTITHLGQVASKGQQHLQVSKKSDEQTTTVSIRSLNRQERIAELARMIGGIKVSAQTLAHAEAMLA